uniref:PHD finger protein ALFIN-LIKE n=1 Tax=Lactuca sativa TaxID=4236 RepID=A0A9R1VI96_LACSA|nr:hypothetical protein LSAT_V11C500283510 [Lactuca sativa]
MKECYNKHIKETRRRLFSMINDLPTVFEVVTEKKPVKDMVHGADGGSKSKSGTKRSSDGQVKTVAKVAIEENYEDDDDDDDDNDDDEEEHGDTQCGSCGGNYNGDEFWIGCDICERWYHGKCVKITPAKAETIKQYKCPYCVMKRAKP